MVISMVMATPGVKRIHFGPALDSMVDPRNVVVINADTNYGRSIKMDYNPLSGEPEEMKVSKVDEFAVPVGSIAEPSWRNEIVGYNTRLERNEALFDLFGYPLIHGGLRFLAGLADVFTLGAFGFSDKERTAASTKEITDALRYNHVTTRKRFLVYGLPPKVPGTDKKVTIEPAGSLPAYDGKLGFDSPEVEALYRGKDTRDYRVLDMGLNSGPKIRHSLRRQEAALTSTYL